MRWLPFAGPWSSKQVLGRPKAIIFDFDYTLGDSSPGVVESYNWAFKRFGYPPLPHDMISRTIGVPVPNAFVSLVGGQHSHRAQDFYAAFLERANMVMVDMTTLFQCTPRVIQELRRRNMRLAIVSTKRRYMIEGILTRDKLLDCFEILVGGEDVAAFKPDPEGVLSVLDRLDIYADSAWYVGDSLVDAETAKRAGVPFIAVLSGFASRPDRYLRDP